MSRAPVYFRSSTRLTSLPIFVQDAGKHVGKHVSEQVDHSGEVDLGGLSCALSGTLFAPYPLPREALLSSETWRQRPAKSKAVGTHNKHTSQESAADESAPFLESAAPPQLPASSASAQVQPEAQSDPASSHLEDVAWVARAQSGDAAAFDSLVVKHSGKLYSLVFQMTANHDDTNDVLQDVWTKVYRSLAGFRGAAKFTTWIHSIAVNMTINFLRRRSKRQAVSLDARVFPSQGAATPLGSPAEEATLHPALISTQTPHSEANLSELQVRLGEALERLTPEHRAVVVMFDIQGLAHAEISAVLGVSEGTVRSRLFYAHRLLQGYLTDFQPETHPSFPTAPSFPPSTSRKPA
ncbi:MAG: sigma-70 family RNA polymerase sigma factor [Verrucomicrobiota bacterium]